MSIFKAVYTIITYDRIAKAHPRIANPVKSR